MGKEKRMKALSSYFKGIVEAGIKESLWFRTAPSEAQKTAKIKILGIEERKYSSMVHTVMRPALVAECECGGETQRFSLLLDNTERVEALPG
jgi:hypothetical protein